MAKHHYLSRAYLKGFSSKDKILWGYPSTKPQTRGGIFKTAPRSAANHEDYYTVPQSWVSRPHNEIEELFGKVESSVSGFLRKANNSDPHFTLEERHTLVAFAAIHFGRVPAAREQNIENYLRITEVVAAMMNMKTGGQRPTQGYTIVENTDIGLMMQTITAALDEFNRMSLKVIYLKDQDCLLTGDNPVILDYGLDDRTAKLRKALFSIPGRPYQSEEDITAMNYLVRVAMPLNRRALLLLDRTGVHGIYPSDPTDPADSLAKSTNMLILSQCREVFSPSKKLINQTLSDLAKFDQKIEDDLSHILHQE